MKIYLDIDSKYNICKGMLYLNIYIGIFWGNNELFL